MGKITVSISGGVLTVESIDPDVELTVIDYDNLQCMADDVSNLVKGSKPSEVYNWLADGYEGTAEDLAAQYREYIGAPAQLECQPA
jgi:hypothetical protein